ncbi:MAG: DUF427 domain-containing protein [Bryobacteraceae bacterium]|nr:DUF427 domain-containing protein [Bryobacteraceae bacterium]
MESVWDYPRPPKVEVCARRIRVVHAGELIAETTKSYRVLETSHPPVYYIPPGDVRMQWVREVAGKRSYCEFKGVANYWDVVVGSVLAGEAAWSYEQPAVGFEAIAHHLAFYASRVDECTVDGERVTPQPGSFYGGWITRDIEGPFKGDPRASLYRRFGKSSTGLD